MNTTWILVANSSIARLFKAEKSFKHMQLLAEYEHPKSRFKEINLVTSGPGRYRNNGQMPGGTMEEPTSPKQVEFDRFARQLATKLEAGRTKNLYQHLVVIAPSHFQGLLNKHCSYHIHNKIAHTLDKDYTKLKEHELPKYLNGRFIYPLAA